MKGVLRIVHIELSQDVLNSSKSKKTDIKSKSLLVLGGFNMDHVTEVSNLLHNHFESMIITKCICRAFCVSMFLFYRNANEYPPLTTSHPNPSQLIPPFSVRFDLTISSKVEQFGRCKGLPTMERIGEGRTRAVTGNNGLMKSLSSPLYSSMSLSLPSSS